MPTASSFTIGAIFSDEQIGTLLEAIWNSESRTVLESELGNRPICNRDQSWVRRQYAPSRYPRFHAPHGWHQDGALGFDYASYPQGNYPADALLRMVTCWIALDDCGVDAPSLEFVTRPFRKLLSPADLGDAPIRARFPVGEFLQARIKAGEGLLFGGHSLHRTFVAAQMTRDRTSIELRFFTRAPERLKPDRFLPVEG